MTTAKYSRLKRYRESHMAAGLCIDCKNTAEPGNIRCAYHLHQDNVGTRRYRRNHPGYSIEPNKRRRQRRRLEGRCERCGLYLAEQDAGHAECQNCLEKL